MNTTVTARHLTPRMLMILRWTFGAVIGALAGTIGGVGAMWVATLVFHMICSVANVLWKEYGPAHTLIVWTYSTRWYGSRTVALLLSR